MNVDRVLATDLVNEVTEPEVLDEVADALFAQLVDKSLSAIRRGLYTLKHAESPSFKQAMAFTESRTDLFALTEDAQEDQVAFREKRAPNRRGRWHVQ